MSAFAEADTLDQRLFRVISRKTGVSLESVLDFWRDCRAQRKRQIVSSEALLVVTRRLSSLKDGGDCKGILLCWSDI